MWKNVGELVSIACSREELLSHSNAFDKDASSYKPENTNQENSIVVVPTVPLADEPITPYIKE
jgi:hypothetical protein